MGKAREKRLKELKIQLSLFMINFPSDNKDTLLLDVYGGRKLNSFGNILPDKNVRHIEEEITWL